MKLRQLTDIAQLVRWRCEVIEAVFGTAPTDAVIEANRDYYMRHIPDGTHYAVVAEDDGVDVGCGSVCFYDELPSPDNPRGRCAYIMSIYVKSEYRSRGAGHVIMEHLVEISRSRGCGKIYLETTESGKSLYRSLGFVGMPDMLKLIE